MIGRTISHYEVLEGLGGWSRRVLLSLLLLAVLLPASAQKEPKRPPDVRYEPSPMEAVKAMLELAGVKKSDLV